MVGSPSCTPPIVYDSLLMSVCGGSSTCCSVSRGVVIVARKRCMPLGQALRERSRVGRRGSPPRPPPRVCARAPPCALPGAWTPRSARQSSNLRLLRRGRRRDRPVHVDPVAAGLDARDDLRHLPLLVHRLEGQPGRDGGDAVQGRDLVRLRLRECQLRARQEEVVHELRPRLAELRKVGDDGLVRFDHVSCAAAAERPAAGVLLGRARHRQVRADPRQRVERRALRLVEPLREARDRDHEPDADGEAEQRQDRPAATAQKLRARGTGGRTRTHRTTPA